MLRRSAREKEPYMVKQLFGALLVTFAVAAPALAQFEDRAVHMNIGGGFTVPNATS